MNMHLLRPISAVLAIAGLAGIGIASEKKVELKDLPAAAQKTILAETSGAKIKDNVLKCPACNGWLDEGITELFAMHPKERRIKMYPEQIDRQPVEVTGPTKGK